MDHMGPQFFHASDDHEPPELSGWVHLGDRGAATARAHATGRAVLHRYSVGGPVHDEEVPDKVANIVTGNRDWGMDEVLHDTAVWHADPMSYLRSVSDAAERGEAIPYTNTWDDDVPHRSIVARAEHLRYRGSEQVR